MDFRGLVFVLFFLLLDLGELQKKKTAADTKHTLCRGSSFGISTVHSSAQLYEMYRAKYSNCTYVDGNLELVDLDQNYDLSFLRDVREVTGYVLIKSVMSDFLWLRNLRIIRGQLLLSQNHHSYSLYVEQNYNDMGMGLKELQFNSLHEIMNGDVYFHDNRLLCHEQTIEWRDILPPNSVVRFNDTLAKSRICPVCDARCTFNRAPHCWGAGPDQCQSITKLNCSDQCLFRCLPGSPNECCHSECAGGCTGPTSSMCWACKNFANDESCVNVCPPKTIYDTTTYQQKPNPDFKYIHGSMCLRHCPKHLYSYESACIRECGSMAVDGHCVPCAENCPIKCPGIKPPEYVHSGNIANFNGCNIVQNSVSILPSTFTGDPSRNLVGLTSADLSVFKTVTEIAGFLQIEGSNVTSLDYFRNLAVIGGIETIPRSAVSFKVHGTQLELLDLKFLEEIRLGSVAVENNLRLCYADGVNWKRLFNLPEQMSYVSNETKESCAKANHSCSSECSSDGCWGPGDDQCLSCAHFRIDLRCIASCDVMPGLYETNQTECKRCHKECRTNCTDNSSATCDECKNVKDGQDCVELCPANKYADNQGNCQYCHDNCDGGCTGGNNTIGQWGCRSCRLFVLDAADAVTSCVNSSMGCPSGFYKKTLQNHPNKDLNEKQACKRCHPECLVCDEYGQSLSSSCKVCAHYRQDDDRCVSECPDDYYLVNGTNICRRCDSLCQNCTGPTASNCTDCKQYRVYNNPDDHSEGFYCTETCPDNIPHKVIEEMATGKKATVCVEDNGSYMDPSTIGKIVGSVIGGVIFLSIVVIVIVVVLYKRAKAEANKVRLTAQLIGVSEAEPLCPTGVNPDMAKLRLIKESELRRGAKIGSGAFGSVYKGIWVPENENVKLIVAIKVLNEGLHPNQTIELLGEVRIMASVNNQYCIRILAFCMTSQMMIVTQLMPHGCLLDFVRKHEAEIGSKVLLNWCTQIAKGMTYLEERSIVHRDLAARNILVQHPEHVRITDFGLSKLLEHNESAFHSAEEKVPIKWMALESIQQQCFTHKSDVWSYGVTLWELFTKGGIPYETVCPSSIPDLLEKGERLPQPSICTIDVYMLMIKCWVIDDKSRPSFRYFAEAFAKMARDPGRYLVIEGDEFLRISSPIIGVKELMRYASIDSGGSEMIIAADDYLHPRGRIRSTGHSDHLETVSETTVDDADGSVQHNISSTSSYPGENSGQRSAVAQRIRRNSQNRDSSHVIARQHSEPGGVRLNSRYCSDPCKAAVLQQQQRLLQTDASPSPPSSAHSAQANPFRRSDSDAARAASRGPVSSPGHASVNSFSSKSSGGSSHAVTGQEIPLSPIFSFEQRPSASEEDYLQPAGGQQTTAFNDLLDSAAGGDSGGSAMTSFVSNPEYFEDVSPDRASEIRTHRRSESEDSTKYYNDLNSASVHNYSSPLTSPVSLSKAIVNG